MNFEFSEAQRQLRDMLRQYLIEHCPMVRRALDGPSVAPALWRGLVDLGLIGAALPETEGGTGGGYLELCVVAEELGRSLALVPFSSSVYLGSELIGKAGADAQKRELLPRLASGELTLAVAVAQGPGNPSRSGVAVTASANGSLDGVTWPVLYGDIADRIVILARGGMDSLSLFLVDASDPGVTRESLESLDPTRGQVRVTLSGARGEPLGLPGEGWETFQAALDRAAVLTAFEQIGGAEAAFQMALTYAKDREAFGRPIGSF